MKNKAILKKKCMGLSLYTFNIFHLGQEIMFTKPVMFKQKIMFHHRYE